tara:strand:+ start:315 stop:599 length:285 start_codon:yes stop_codon:yes gene_type:complete
MKEIKLITAVALGIAVFPLPYAYYQILRIGVTISAGISAYNSFENNNMPWVIIFSIIAIIFNPVMPIYLDKGSWFFIDIISMIIFVYNIYRIES